MVYGDDEEKYRRMAGILMKRKRPLFKPVPLGSGLTDEEADEALSDQLIETEALNEIKEAVIRIEKQLGTIVYEMKKNTLEKEARLHGKKTFRSR